MRGFDILGHLRDERAADARIIAASGDVGENQSLIEGGFGQPRVGVAEAEGEVADALGGDEVDAASLGVGAGAARNEGRSGGTRARARSGPGDLDSCYF
jgi:hypothetical protein